MQDPHPLIVARASLEQARTVTNAGLAASLIARVTASATVELATAAARIADALEALAASLIATAAVLPDKLDPEDDPLGDDAFRDEQLAAHAEAEAEAEAKRHAAADVLLDKLDNLDPFTALKGKGKGKA